MYLPTHFREDRLDVLHDFVERHPLGALIAGANGELTADHLPMLLERDQGAKGTLRGHVARANPLWRSAVNGTEVLVIFQGSDAYVSPSSYPSKKEHGQVVPTWNYAVVHARGRIHWFADPAQLHALVCALTDHHELAKPEPWAVTDAPESYVASMLKAIVGFQIELTELEGKFKSSQNKSEADRAGVLDALGVDCSADELSELVRAPNS